MPFDNRVVITRPVGDAASWQQALTTAGMQTLKLPLIEIAPLADVQSIQAAWQQLHGYQAVMYVSGNAVAHFFRVLPDKSLFVAVDNAWIATKIRAYATGPGTVAALREVGVAAGQIDAPPADAAQFDSEALWQVVRHQVKPGWRVLIVRGSVQALTSGSATRSESSSATLSAPVDGQVLEQTLGQGRDWFAQQLLATGAKVDFLVSYQRRMPQWTLAQKALAKQCAADGSVWLLSSSEGLANLAACLPQQNWSQARAVATHARIAQAARTIGFGVVCESRPSADSVIATLKSMVASIESKA